MIRGVVASVVLLGVLAVAGPAAAAPSLDILAFTVRSGSMSEVMSFQGDNGPACAQAGVCGYSGTVSYGFGAIRAGDGTVLVTRSGRRSRALGFATLSVGGLTSASVNGPGGGQPCTEKILHRFDYVYVVGDARHVTFQFHPADALPDYLDSICTGPSDADVGFAGALPTVTVKTKDLNKRRLTVSTSSVKPFHTGPFMGTVAFNVTLVLAHQSISDFPLTSLSLGAGARRALPAAHR